MPPIIGIRGLLKFFESQITTLSEKEEGKNYVNGLLRDLRLTKEVVSRTQRERSKEFMSVYGWKSHVLDYIIFLHFSLWLICKQKFPVDNSLPDKKDEIAMKMVFMALMLTHLTNSLLSVRILIERGLDVQAKKVFRSYIEYSDLAFAVLGDKTFFENYRRMSEGEEEAKKVWYKFTRPNALTKILEKIFIDMDGTREYWDTLQRIRDRMYSNLSEYTHGHFLAVYIGAVSEVEGGEIMHAPLGVITESIDETLKNTIHYASSFLEHAIIAIVQYQKLPFMKFGEEGEKFVVHYKILELFMKICFKIWEEPELPPMECPRIVSTDVDGLTCKM